MRPEAFIIWLSGYVDACGNSMTTEQVAVVKEKMAEVMLPGFFRQMPPRPVQQG